MSSAQIPVTVATASGRITGVRRDGLHYFHSVRYSTIPSPYSVSYTHLRAHETS